MKPDELRRDIVALRKKLEAALDNTRTHFGMHMAYIAAYDDLEELARKAAKHLPKEQP